MNEPNYFQNPNSAFLLNIVQEGDGLELLRDLKDEVAQLVIFDPQYRDPVDTTDKKFYRDLKALPPTINQNQEKIKEFCQQIERVLKKAGWLLIWINQRILLDGNFRDWIPSNLAIKWVLVWIKGEGSQLYKVMGQTQNHFIHTEEYCLVIRKKPFKSPVLKKRTTNIFNHLVSQSNRHNCHMKPLEMTKSIIEQLTQEGDLIIDPCAGSFVSLRACQNLKRDFLGTDLTLRKLMKFNLNKERSRKLLRKEGKEKNNEF